MLPLGPSRTCITAALRHAARGSSGCLRPWGTLRRSFVAAGSSTVEAAPIAAQRQAARWAAAGTLGLLTVTAAAVSVDEGLRRCADFWIVVLPIYLHYLYVDKVAHPVPAGGEISNDRSAAFEELHARYSPVVESATLRMRGFYLKAAQMMSMREDFLPVQYLVWTRKLQHEAPVVLSAADARSCVARELGLPDASGLAEVFSDWADEPIGCASIGQVYRATLRSTGERVAVKVQSPGIEELFRADIRTLKVFTAMALPWAVESMNAIERMFETEFDYDLERRNLEAVRGNVLRRWGGCVRVPRPVPELCTRRVLCMELLEGEKLVDGVKRRMKALAGREGCEEEQLEVLRAGPRTARSARAVRWATMAWRAWRYLCWGDRAEGVPDLASLMETIMSIHGEQVLIDGLFNADPHPGNILLLQDGRTLGLIDFGQARRLSLDFRLVLARLVVALARGDKGEAVRLEQELGLRSKHGREDVRYRLCSFWLDRDTEDVMQGMNLHDFMAWGEREDPVLAFPEDLYVVCRCSFMIRSLALAFGVRLSTAQYWRPHAEALLREHATASC